MAVVMAIRTQVVVVPVATEVASRNVGDEARAVVVMTTTQRWWL